MSDLEDAELAGETRASSSRRHGTGAGRDLTASGWPATAPR